MASVVDICNLALANVADEAGVSAIDPPDGSAQADHCARFYPIARDAMLEAFAWTFATTRKALTLLSYESDQWTFAYALPNPCLRPLAVLVYQAPDDGEPQPFTVEYDQTGTRRVLLTNVEDATLKYITQITDTTLFTPSFVVCLGLLLGSFVAFPITKNEKLADSLYRRYLAAGGPPINAVGANGNSTKNNQYRTDWVPAAIAARR